MYKYLCQSLLLFLPWDTWQQYLRKERFALARSLKEDRGHKAMRAALGVAVGARYSWTRCIWSMTSGFVVRSTRWRSPDTIFVLYGCRLDFIDYPGAIQHKWQVKTLAVFQKHNYNSWGKEPQRQGPGKQVYWELERLGAGPRGEVGSGPGSCWMKQVGRALRAEVCCLTSSSSVP